METSLDELKRYVRLSGDDARRLLAFRAVAQPHFAQIASDLEARIREHAGSAFLGEAYLGDEPSARLHEALVGWLSHLLSGRYDDAYREESAKIGSMHARAGVPQRHVVAAMSVVRAGLGALTETYGAEGAAYRQALGRILDIELALMLDAYRDVEQDRTDRARATTEALASAAEHAGVIILGADDAGRIRIFNGEAERLSGRSRADVIGLPFAGLMLGEDASGDIAARVARVVSGGARVDRFEAPFRTAGGAVLDLRWDLTHHGGVPACGVAMFAVAEDVTAHRAAVDRTLRRERLEAVGNLAAGLAHEMRNPLNGAQLHLTFLDRALARSRRDPEVAEALEVVGGEIKRLAQLVSEFLEFARPRPLQREPTSITALCERVVAIAGAQALAAHVTLALDLPQTEDAIDLDPDRVQQLLLNLVQNAIEALESKGGGTVRLRARLRPRSVVLEVEDDGPGLASADAPIFDAFFSTKVNGTGLGLAIAHRIATDHGGQIDVRSRPGSTCFQVVLPGAPGDAERRQEPS